MRHDARIGTTVAGCRIEDVIGRGGMGAVYLAEQIALRRAVALKLLAPELAEDAEFRARFQEEARIAASLDHPNVVPIYDAGESETGELYIVMRRVPGCDLRALLRAEGGRLPPARAAALVEQVAAALDAAHAHGLVHRDVKPANVLVGDGDRAYLTDFGLTKLAASSGGLTRTGQWLGTIDYCAPEQIEGRRVDARTDVYALGCLLFQTLSGTVPFPRDHDLAKVWAHVNDEPPSLAARCPDLPAALDAVVVKALAKEPDERWASAGGLARAVVAAVAGETAPDDDRSVATGVAAPGPSSADAEPDAGTVTHADAEATPTTVAAIPAATMRQPAPPPSAAESGHRRGGPATIALGVAAALLLGGGTIAAMTLGGGEKDPAAATTTTNPSSTAGGRAGGSPAGGGRTAGRDEGSARAAGAEERSAGATTSRRASAPPSSSTTSSPEPTPPSTGAPIAYTAFSGSLFAGERPAEWATDAEEREENDAPPRYRSQWSSDSCGCVLVIDVLPTYGKSALENAREADGGTISPAAVGPYGEAALRTASSGDLHTATYYVAYGSANYAIRAEARAPATALAIAERAASALLPY